jgi:hypothetical protein
LRHVRSREVGEFVEVDVELLHGLLLERRADYLEKGKKREIRRRRNCRPNNPKRQISSRDKKIRNRRVNKPSDTEPESDARREGNIRKVLGWLSSTRPRKVVELTRKARM